MNIDHGDILSVDETQINFSKPLSKSKIPDSKSEENMELSELRELRFKNVNRLIIGNLNINSIPNKFDQLKFLIKDKVDILLITETKLDSTFPETQFLIPFRKDRNRHGGGLLLYIREDIPAKELHRHTFSENIEGIFVEINLRKTKWLIFGTYHPPSQNDEYYFQNISNSLDIYTQNYEKFLLMGDFNAEDFEPYLSQFLFKHDAKNIVKHKTCFKSIENPSCNDLFITNHQNQFQNTSSIPAGLSDCYNLVVTVLKATFKKAKAQGIFYRNYKTFSEINFKSELKCKLEKIEVSTY